MRSHRIRRSIGALAAIALLLVALVACSDGTTQNQPSSSTPTATPTTSAPAAACADVAALKSSLEVLVNVKPLQNGLTSLNTAITNVKISLVNAEASASAALQPAVAQVKTAFAQVQTATNGLTADNLKERAPSITLALKQLRTATSTLATTLTHSCRSSSATPS
jgi:hypothetical protein